MLVYENLIPEGYETPKKISRIRSTESIISETGVENRFSILANKEKESNYTTHEESKRPWVPKRTLNEVIKNLFSSEIACILKINNFSCKIKYNIKITFYSNADHDKYMENF